MDERIRDRIILLRQEGMGYLAIANDVGVSRDKVRYICKSRGLGGIAADRDVERGEVCANCRKPIEQPPKQGRRKKYCSEECRRAWWAMHPDKLKKSKKAMYLCTCGYCHKPFTAYGHADRKYCSRDCYIKNRFWT